MKAEKLLARNKKVLYKEFTKNKDRYQNFAWLFSDKNSFDSFAKDTSTEASLCKIILDCRFTQMRNNKMGPYSTSSFMAEVERTALRVKRILQSYQPPASENKVYDKIK